MPPTELTQKIIEIIRDIPYGTVSTYGTIAAMAGNRKGARQVVRVLHTYSRREKLPWHRVVNREGKISLPDFHGGESQRTLLEAEGIVFSSCDRIDLDRFRWRHGE